MTMVKLVLKVTSWVCFMIGLVWTNKVSLESEEAGPTPVAESAIIPLSGAGNAPTLEVLNPGGLQAELSVGSMSESMLLRADSWLAEFKEDYGAEWTLRLSFGTAGPSWEVPVRDFEFRSGGSLLKNDNSFLYLAQNTFTFAEAGTYTLKAEFLGAEEAGSQLFEEASFFLLLGDQNEDVQNFVRLDPKPGLLLLGGTFGVFIHLFLVLIHLIVPWREALPEVESEF